MHACLLGKFSLHTFVSSLICVVGEACQSLWKRSQQLINCELPGNISFSPCRAHPMSEHRQVPFESTTSQGYDTAFTIPEDSSLLLT